MSNDEIIKDEPIIEETISPDNSEPSNTESSNIDENTEVTQDIYGVKSRRYIPKKQEISKTKKFLVKLFYLLLLALEIFILIWTVLNNKDKDKNQETIVIETASVDLVGTKIEVPHYGYCVKNYIKHKNNELLTPDASGNYTSYKISTTGIITDENGKQISTEFDTDNNVVLKNGDEIIAIIPKEEVLEIVNANEMNNDNSQYLFIKVGNKYVKLTKNEFYAYITIPQNISVDTPNVAAPDKVDKPDKIETPDKVEKPSVDISTKVTSPTPYNVEDIKVTVPNVDIPTK